MKVKTNNVLNQKRVDSYDFRIFKMDGVVYLFDKSSRTYPCTSTAHFYCEAIVDEVTGECIDYSGYFKSSTVEQIDSVQVVLDEEGISPSVDEQTAWDEARFMAVQML